MDIDNKSIILVDFNEELVDRFQQIHGSVELNKRTIKSYTNESILVAGIEKGSLFIYIKEDILHNRLFLRKLKTKFKDLPIFLCSTDAKVAVLAWQMDANFFSLLPLNERNIQHLLKKVDNPIPLYQPKIKFNFKGGYDVVAPNDICFCAASGNYTKLFLSNNKKLVITFKLKMLEERFKEFPFLARLGRSYIINLDKIAKVEGDSVFFRGTPAIKLNISKNYINKIKGELLWMS